MGKVLAFSGVTRLNMPVDAVLDGAKGCLEGVVVIGYTKDGEEYFASTYADGGEVLWLIERCKRALLNTEDEDA